MKEKIKDIVFVWHSERDLWMQEGATHKQIAKCLYDGVKEDYPNFEVFFEECVMGVWYPTREELLVIARTKKRKELMHPTAQQVKYIRNKLGVRPA